MTMGCYNSLATTHRVHDISPILPHVVADSTWSHTFSQGRLTWYLYVVMCSVVGDANVQGASALEVATHIHMYINS